MGQTFLREHQLRPFWLNASAEGRHTWQSWLTRTHVSSSPSACAREEPRSRPALSSKRVCPARSGRSRFSPLRPCPGGAALTASPSPPSAVHREEPRHVGLSSKRVSCEEPHSRWASPPGGVPWEEPRHVSPLSKRVCPVEEPRPRQCRRRRKNACLHSVLSRVILVIKV